MLLDTSAWVELFRGTEKGSRVKAALEEGNCCTCLISLAEVSGWAAKEKRDVNELVRMIERTSEIIEVSRDICILAGELNVKRKQAIPKWGMMDSFILATSLLYGLTILTCDSDFRDLDNAVVL